MIPEGWEENLLGEEAYIKARIGWRGLASSEYTQSGPYLVAGQHIKGSQIDWTSCDHISDFRYQESAEIILKSGDVIISKDGTIGRVGYVENLPGPATINGTMMLIRAGQRLYPKFLYFYFQSENFIRLIKEKVSGSSVPHIFQRDIVNLCTPLPPITEQKRIAEVLGEVDAAIDATNAIIEQTKKVKQGLLQILLTRGIGHTKFKPSPLGEIPESWEIKALEDSGIAVIDGDRGSAYPNGDDFQNSGHCLFLNAKNVTKNGFRFEECQFITEEKNNQLRKGTLERGDLVVTTRGTIGNIASYTLDIPFNVIRINSGMVILRNSGTSLATALLTTLLNSPVIESQIKMMSFGSAQQQLTVGILNALNFPIPPLPEQKAIAEIFETVDSQLTIETNKLASIQQLKKGLMHDLLTGKVRVPVEKPVLKMVDTAAQSSAPQKPVQPAFKRAVLAAEITHQLCQNPKFGAVKLEKIIDLCERHLDLDAELDRTAYRQAAGPYDNRAKRSIEENFKKNKWFDVQRSDGKGVKYVPLENCGQHKTYFDRYFGNISADIQSIIDLLKNMKTEQCEIVATLYAAWNDFLLKGQTPDDETIVNDVLNNWHDKKQQIAKDRWLKALPWMRQKNLVPHGGGRQTKGTKPLQ